MVDQMDMHDLKDEIIAAFLSGVATDEERAFLLRWISASSENKHYFAEKCEVWFSSMSFDEKKLYDSAKAYSKFSLKRVVMESKTKKSLKATLVRRISVAVAAVACIALSVIVFRGLYKPVEHIQPVADLMVRSALGSKTSLTLPDGTKVCLNSGSTLTYSPDFGNDSRVVKLDGEAYFDVIHDDMMPFEVISGNLTVRDLGTSFSVCNYGDDDEVSVALVEGKVEFSVGNSSATELVPGDLAVVNKENGIQTVEKDMAGVAVLWKDGKYVFEDETLASIVRKLERGFDVTINIEVRSLANMSFNGNFDQSTSSVDEILSTLASTGKFKFSSKERQYNIFLIEDYNTNNY